MSAIGKLAAVLAEHRAQRLAIWVVQGLADGLDRHIDTPQRTNQPCLADLGWLIAPVSAVRVNYGGPQQAKFVIMPQRVDRQAADEGEDADTQQVADLVSRRALQER